MSPFSWRPSLRHSLVFLGVAGLLYVAGIAFFIVQRVQPRAQERQEHAEVLAREFSRMARSRALVARGIREARQVLAEDPSRASHLLDSLRTTTPLIGAMGAMGSLTGVPPEMRIVLARGAELESELGIALREVVAFLEAGEGVTARRRLARADSLEGALAQEQLRALLLGLEDLQVYHRALLDESRLIERVVTGWFLVGILVIPFALLFLAWRVYRPLQALDRGMDLVAAGKLDVRLGAHPGDELGRLARHFNEMVIVLKERAEAESQERARLTERAGRLLEDSFDEILLFDAGTLQILEANRGARARLGYSQEELRGFTVLHFLPELGEGRFRALLEEVRSSPRGPFLFTTTQVGGNGISYPVEVNLQFFSGEVPPVFVFIARDLTERLEQEEHIRHASKMEAVGQLTGGVAHDFNNLLTVVMGSLGLVMDPGTPPEDREVLLREALTAAGRGAELTRRLLAFSRKQALRPEALEMNGLILRMKGLLERALGETIRVETRPAPEVWICWADRAQLETALLNLAVNARDAMPSGGTLTLETGNAVLAPDRSGGQERPPPGDYVMVAVRDTGVGMSPEVLELAFDPFFTTKELGKGTGLGLSMVYGFAAQSGGQVKLESEPGRGTTVRLYFPRYQGDGTAARLHVPAE